MADKIPSWAVADSESVPSWAVADVSTTKPDYSESDFHPATSKYFKENAGKISPTMALFKTAQDVGSFVTRAVGAMRGGKMSDEEGFALKKESAFAQGKQESDRKSLSKDSGESEFKYRQRFAKEYGYQYTDPEMLDLGYRLVDPTNFVFEALGAGTKLAAKGIGAIEKSAGGAKRFVSNLSQIDQKILDRASTESGAKALSQAAIDSKGGDLMPVADELSQRVQGLNSGREALAEGSRSRQASQFEEGLTESLTGNPKIISGTSPGVQGERMKGVIDAAKKPMQDAFVQGDQQAVGRLRSAPVPQDVTSSIVEKRVPILDEMGNPVLSLDKSPMFKTESVTVKSSAPAVVKELSGVLSEFKALSPTQGVPKITKGAQNALRSVMGLADKQANNIDDLINLKGQLRSMHSQGGFEGNVFDASVDDLAFAKAENVINGSIEKAIQKADPQNASKIIALTKANNEMYATTKKTLSDLAGGIGQTVNSDRLVSKVAQLGPQRGREIIEASRKNPVLAPVVDELRKGFVDDLLLSSMKDGVVNPQAFAKRWNDARALSPELKSTWLTKDQIDRIDGSVALGTMEIGKPGLLGEKIFGSATKPSLTAGTRRLENIGTDVNREALSELQFIDGILGTDYMTKAKDVFEGRQLGLTAEGKAPLTPLSKTGRSGLGFQVGDVLGGAAGAIIGILSGGLSNAAEGLIIGGAARPVFKGAIGYVQSPAGAIAANKILNKWAIKKAGQYSERAEALAASLQKAQSQAVKTRLISELTRELSEKSQSDSMDAGSIESRVMGHLQEMNQ